MKKIMVILLIAMFAASMVFIGAGCKAEEAVEEEAVEEEAVEEEAVEEEAVEEEAEEEAVEEKDWEIAVVAKDMSNAWFVRMGTGVTRYAEETGINAFYTGPSAMDAAAQVQVLTDLVYQEVDAICVVPIDPAACEPILGEAMEKGIIVIVHEGSSMENMTWGLEAFSNKAYGATIMDNLAKDMGEEGLYTTMVGQITNASHNEWADAGVAHQLEAYPNMQLLEEEPRVESEVNIEVAYEKAKQLFKKYPDLKGIMGTSSKDAPGTARAIEELGLEGQKFACGSGLPNESSPYLKNGTLTAVTLWDSSDASYAMCEMARQILDDEFAGVGADLGLPGYESLVLMEGSDNVLEGKGWIIITAENVDTYDF